MNRALPSIRIVIADAQPIFRAGLRRALEAEGGLSVVGETGSGDEMVSLVRDLTPDLLLFDPEMPRSDGLRDLARTVDFEHRPSTILLTANLDRDLLVEAVRVGVRGVVSKDAPGELLLKAVRSVMAGQYWLGREEVADVLRSLVQAEPPRNGAADGAVGDLPVTPREGEVVRAVVQGLSNREIASQLGVSEDTVKHHLTNIYDKLGVSSRVELVVHAMSRGPAPEGPIA